MTAARPKTQSLRTKYAAQQSSGGRGPRLQPLGSPGGPSPGESPRVPVSTFSAEALLSESATVGVLIQQDPEQDHASSRESNAASSNPPPGLPQPHDQDLPPAVQANMVDTKAGSHHVDRVMDSSEQPSSPEKLAGLVSLSGSMLVMCPACKTSSPHLFESGSAYCNQIKSDQSSFQQPDAFKCMTYRHRSLHSRGRKSKKWARKEIELFKLGTLCPSSLADITRGGT